MGRRRRSAMSAGMQRAFARAVAVTQPKKPTTEKRLAAAQAQEEEIDEGPSEAYLEAERRLQDMEQAQTDAAESYEYTMPQTDTSPTAAPQGRTLLLVGGAAAAAAFLLLNK